MDDLTGTFFALGNTTRFAIVDRLMKDGEQPAGNFSDIGDISPPALSRHLKILRESGLIHQRIDKQRRLYSIRPEAVQAIGDWSLTYREFWAGSFERLADALIKESKKT